jgi:hypothetical protein
MQSAWFITNICSPCDKVSEQAPLFLTPYLTAHYTQEMRKKKGGGEAAGRREDNRR